MIRILKNTILCAAIFISMQLSYSPVFNLISDFGSKQDKELSIDASFINSDIDSAEDEQATPINQNRIFSDFFVQYEHLTPLNFAVPPLFSPWRPPQFI